jgi:two-component system CheB/CheR fusion protein
MMGTSANLSPLMPEPLSDQATFPVVGIGASAGGLDAFTRLFSTVSATTGMAYVVVQHLDPTHASLLPVLLARVASLPVHAVQDGMTVEPNQIYVIPPQADMTLEHGALRLFPRRQDHNQHFAIDIFFFSLAHECGPLAIGILLSGTGSDGTVGLQEIKAEEGITFAQDTRSAAFPQMPQNAISAGCVDHILSPESIACTLPRLHTPTYLAHAQSPELVATLPEEEHALTTILLRLKQWTGVDFLAYKRDMLKRRVMHHMSIQHIERFAEYATYLREHPAEIEALFQNVLIPVTRFFRDEAAFAALTQYAFPDIVRDRSPEDPIRIWIPGCSTGEEAYSLAMCLFEFLKEHRISFPIQLFATDINPRGLAHAREGIYLANALSVICAERRQRFFVPVDQKKGTYRIARAVRKLCVFALHNVARDPPFSHLDLVSCRNVLIYLGTDCQRQLFQTFHYALKPHGFLLLGTSESVDPLSQLFTFVERRQKLYIRKDVTENIPFFGGAPEKGQLVANNHLEESIPVPGEAMQNNELQQEVDRLLLASYVPASVAIDAEMNILQVRGHTSPYLELAPGKISLNLLNMAREGLGPGLRSTIAAARKSNGPVTKEHIQIIASGAPREIRITVLPLKEPPAGKYFLVLFEDLMPVTFPALSDKQADSIGKRGSATRQHIATLELELASTRVEMQESLKEHETIKEELQAANEEIRTSNEELQSINEELETSQEELQSTNQELTTVNQELVRSSEQVKLIQERTNAIVETVREPLVVLTRDVHVERANAAFYQFFHVLPQETEGCLLYDLGNGQWNIPRLRFLFEQVATTDEPFHDFEVEHIFPLIGHKIMLLNARLIVDKPAGTEDHLILLAIEDITARKELERQKDILLGMASHELKTPLTSAKLELQLLHRRFVKTGDEQPAAQLQKVDVHLNRLTHLIDGFLDIAAIETGKFLLQREAFAADDLIQEVCEEILRATAGQRIAFVQKAHAEVYGDRVRTGEMLSNLLTNAIKYAPSEQPIEVKTICDGNWVIVSVQDHGKGIPKDQQARIFERFYRSGEAGQKRQPGTGLGLYLAAEIIKQQGGRIWVESVPEAGATFFFTLPRHIDSSQHETGTS